MSNKIYNPLPIPNPIPAGKTIWNYKLGDYSVPFLQVYYNGEWVTMPMAKDGINAITSTIVNAGRNAEAQVIGEQIGRTQSKVDTYIIPFLYAHEWTKILKIFKDQIHRKVRYYDQEAGDFIEREMYVNDRKATVFAFKQDGSGAVEIWKDAEIHFIDMRAHIIKWNLQYKFSCAIIFKGGDDSMRKIKIRKGERYGKLVTIEETRTPSGRRAWKCICDCGVEVIREASTLKMKGVHACIHCVAKIRATRHSMCGSSLYNTYSNMKQRCGNPNRPDYKWYGAEGKTICKEWLGKSGFKNFQNWAISSGYKDGLSIDRIDYNKGYEPQNCRWVELKMQQTNTRRNHFITYKGETHTIAQWERIYGLRRGALKSRVKKWENIDVNKIFEPFEKGSEK